MIVADNHPPLFASQVIDLGAEDERRYVELDETISAIDEAIEHKNCILLQGRDPYASSADVTVSGSLEEIAVVMFQLSAGSFTCFLRGMSSWIGFWT